MLPEDASPPTEHQSLPADNLPRAAQNLPPAAERAAPTAEIAATSAAHAAPRSPYASPALEPAAVLPAAIVADRRPRVWTVFVLYVTAFIVGQIVSVAVLMVVAAATYGLPALTGDPAGVLGDTVNSLWGMLTANLTNQIIVGGSALLAALLSPIAWRKRLRWVPAPISYGTLAVSVIGGLGISNAFSCLDGLGLLPKSQMIEYLSESMQSLDAESLPFAVLFIGVLPGIAEELLFRGYIQTRLSRRWGRHWGVGITAVLFGIMHIDPVHAAFACLIGLYLGYLTERAGSLRPAMVVHALNNSAMVLSAYLGLAIEGRRANLFWLSVSLTAAGAGIGWLRRALPYAPALPVEPVFPIEPPAMPFEQPSAENVSAAPDSHPVL